MRELSNVELELVEGGNPILIGMLAVGGVVAIGGLGLIAYGISQGCSGSMEVSTEGIKIEVTCPPWRK